MTGVRRLLGRSAATGLPLLVLLASAAPGAVEPRVRARPVSEPIRVDGALEEPAWAMAEPATGFRQRDPHEGEAATEATEVRVLYDDATLYVGVRARDREPEKVIARLLERDRIMEQGLDNAARFTGDDVIALTLDPFHDHRSAFFFATNPNGAEFDALVTDESPTLNVDWRAVWRVAARRTSEGWGAEFAIPFRSLRYPRADGEQVWGFDVERIVRRRNEDALWSAWSRAEGGLNRVSRAGHLEGLAGLPRAAWNVEVKPFGLEGVTRERGADGRAPESAVWRLGADAKWEVRPGLVLDATARPDFAQVEADDQIVNLTRFEVFLPEKRDFFLENAGIFDFGTRGSYETPPFLMFFSRRIGIVDGGEVPLLGGLRLSGRAGKQTLGVLDVLTDEALSEPRTNFGVARLKRDVGERGYLGGMVADRRTKAASETDFGADASVWPSSGLNLQAFAVRTTRSDGASDSAFRGAAEYSADPVYLYGEYLQIGPDARTGMGFVTRTDLRRGSGKAQYTLRPPVRGLRRVDVFAGGKYQARVDGHPQDANGFAGLSAGLDSGDGLSVTHVRGYVVLDGGFDLAGRIPIGPGRYDLRDTVFSLYTSQNRPLTASVSGDVQRLWDGDVSSVSGSLAVRGGAHLSLSASHTRSEASLPRGAFVAHVTALRAGWAFSTRLAAHVYAQYNSLDRRLVANVRLRFIYRPGSDLYVVFNEERGEPGDPRALLSRGFAVKGTWLVRF
ncbi:MAG TPA: DUF5916 domain-containing protein [Vicinamibacteria bacterium]|nr:DUF5916 domain-containing protein [Vicinamibacteria bacterium]